MNPFLNKDIRNTLNAAADILAKAGSVTPRLDAEVLLAFSLQTDRLGLYKQPERGLTENEGRLYNASISRRAAGEPVAYITGVKEFWSLTFKVNPHVLIPRPETEVLVEETLAVCAGMRQADCHILEIGTGSGAVSIALAKELDLADITATDISPGALSMAKENAALHGVEKRVSFLLGDLFEPLAQTFDIIVSNPPYVSAGEFDKLPREIKDYEPSSALLAGTDGLDFYRRIIGESRRYLQKDGWLLMEMGDGQWGNLLVMLKDAGDFDSVNVRIDYGGTKRVVKAHKK